MRGHRLAEVCWVGAGKTVTQGLRPRSDDDEWPRRAAKARPLKVFEARVVSSGITIGQGSRARRDCALTAYADSVTQEEGGAVVVDRVPAAAVSHLCSSFDP